METWKATVSALGGDHMVIMERRGKHVSFIQYCIVTHLSLNYSAVIRTGTTAKSKGRL